MTAEQATHEYSSPEAAHDRELTRSLEAWFTGAARPLPWRTEVRDPYRALVSELMLQQTQVSRVIEKYSAFIERFPTAKALALAPEDEVLAAWAGLGYYRRARLLHACAKAIIEEHGGDVPDSVGALLALPGIGRYTAGAIASMVFGQRAPIVDGNVTRVLLRIHNKAVGQTEKTTVAWAWSRAEDLVDASAEPGVFNEAMMELGATVCTPKAPRCLHCPISGRCAALAAGTTESIPIPKPRAKQRPLYCASVIIERNGSIVLEQRPSEGMWGGMYQTPTVERDDRPPTAEEIAEALGIGAKDLRPGGAFTHVTTHRIVEFTLYRASRFASTRKDRIEHPLDELDALGISNAQRKALALSGILGDT